MPRIWGHRPASITTSFHGQWTLGGKQLYSRDMISLGNRYTVQGFDGENTLMAESGWYSVMKLLAISLNGAQVSMLM